MLRVDKAKKKKKKAKENRKKCYTTTFLTFSSSIISGQFIQARRVHRKLAVLACGYGGMNERMLIAVSFITGGRLRRLGIFFKGFCVAF